MAYRRCACPSPSPAPWSPRHCSVCCLPLRKRTMKIEMDIPNGEPEPWIELYKDGWMFLAIDLTKVKVNRPNRQKIIIEAKS